MHGSLPGKDLGEKIISRYLQVSVKYDKAPHLLEAQSPTFHTICTMTPTKKNLPHICKILNKKVYKVHTNEYKH